MISRWLVFLLFLGTIGHHHAKAQVRDVPPDHWAYQAVNELAARGWVLGYPDGRFLGTATLTRYEMATIIKRVIDRLENQSPASPVRDAEPNPVVHPSVSPEDLANVQRLIEEFKTELTVIGTDLEAIKARLDNDELRLQGIEDAINDPEGPVQATAASVKKLQQTKIGGYIQFRYQSREDSRDNLLPGGATANQDYFFLRRNRIKVTHTVRDFTQFAFQIDAGSGNAVEIKDAYLTLPLMKARSLDTPPTLWAGQFNYPFGFEIQQSSSERLFPERSRGERALFAGERDRGVKVEGTLRNNAFLYQLGIVNGNGIQDANRIAGSAVTSVTFRDPNRDKDFVGRFLYEPPTGFMALGASVYSGKMTGYTGAKTTDGKEIFDVFDKTRFGVEARYYGLADTIVQGEYLVGKEYNASRKIDGVVKDSADVRAWYAQVLRTLAEKNTLGLRYDYYDPDTSDPVEGQSLTSYVGIPTVTLAASRLLSEATKLTIAYEMPRLPRKSDGTRDKQDLFTVQLQYSY